MNEAAQPPHPFPRSVEAFEQLLERAQAGEIAAFAAIVVDQKGVVTWKWHFGARPQTDLIGGIECMQWVMVTNAMQPPLQAPAQVQTPDPPTMPEPPTSVRQ